MNTSYVTAATHDQSLQSQRLTLPLSATVHMYGMHPTCELCQTDEFLVYERVQVVGKDTKVEPLLWDVDCWCGKCETFYGFRTVHPPKSRAALEGF